MGYPEYQTYQIEINKEQKRAILLALNCQICFVETGDAAMSAESARLTGQKHLINDLSECQQHSLVNLKKLHTFILQSEPKQVRRAK
jgi:hypothetical protein